LYENRREHVSICVESIDAFLLEIDANVLCSELSYCLQAINRVSCESADRLRANHIEQNTRGLPIGFSPIALPHHGQNCFAQALMNSEKSGVSKSSSIASSLRTRKSKRTRKSAALRPDVPQRKSKPKRPGSTHKKTAAKALVCLL